MNKPKITSYIACSVDGYIAKEDGSLEWLDCAHLPNEDYGFQEFFSSLDAIVMGRKTYEKIMTFEKWPYSGKKVVVMSSVLQNVHEEAQLSKATPSEVIAKLHEENFRHVWIDGGITVSAFLQSGLIDRLIISIIPTLLGSGIPLFNPMDRPINCKLITSKAYASGLVQNNYEIL